MIEANWYPMFEGTTKLGSNALGGCASSNPSGLKNQDFLCAMNCVAKRAKAGRFFRTWFRNQNQVWVLEQIRADVVIDG